MVKKHLLFNTDGQLKTIMIFIPKRRGEGYLKSPFGGHHANKYYWRFIAETRNVKEFSDAIDIDGYLAIEGNILNSSITKEFLVYRDKIIKILEEVFDHVEGSMEIKSSEAWKLLKIKQ